MDCNKLTPDNVSTVAIGWKKRQTDVVTAAVEMQLSKYVEAQKCGMIPSHILLGI